MSATTMLCWDVRMWRPIGDLGTWGKRNHVQPEDDGAINQNLNVKMCWFLHTYVTCASTISRELFKGRDTEVTHSFQNGVHVGLHRHQPQNQWVKILESALSITCCVVSYWILVSPSVKCKCWICDVSSTVTRARLQGCRTSAGAILLEFSKTMSAVVPRIVHYGITAEGDDSTYWRIKWVNTGKAFGSHLGYADVSYFCYYYLSIYSSWTIWSLRSFEIKKYRFPPEIEKVNLNLKDKIVYRQTIFSLNWFVPSTQYVYWVLLAPFQHLLPWKLPPPGKPGKYRHWQRLTWPAPSPPSCLCLCSWSRSSVDNTFPSEGYFA